MKNPKRTKVAKGIYQDQCGFLAEVSQGRLRRSQRFPRGTAIAFMEAWRIRTRAELAEDSDDTRTIDEPIPERGTFAHDLPRHLKKIEGRASYKADRSRLRAWLPFIGRLKRTAIRPSHVRAAFSSGPSQIMRAKPADVDLERRIWFVHAGKGGH